MALTNPEPWLRGTLTNISVIERALLHSLEMAQEDMANFCHPLTPGELEFKPYHLPSVSFQLRHIARSLDRFCTYAEGNPLTDQQLVELATEHDEPANLPYQEMEESIAKTRKRLPAITAQPLETPIAIGRKSLPTTLAGLLIHTAEHTQRHVGQAITTAKLLLAMRPN